MLPMSLVTSVSSLMSQALEHVRETRATLGLAQTLMTHSWLHVMDDGAQARESNRPLLRP